MNSPDQFSAEGNGGGDTLDITLLSNGRLKLIVGHCCVREINHIVPVEFVTAILTRAVLDHGSVENAIRSIRFSDDFIEQLVGKIEEIR